MGKAWKTVLSSVVSSSCFLSGSATSGKKKNVIISSLAVLGWAFSENKMSLLSDYSYH